MNVKAFWLLSLCALAACAAPAPPPQVAVPAQPPVGEPGNVAGMDAARIRVAFGAPQFVRKDGQMELWRYDGSGCKAFFFMYPRGESLVVKHVETLPRPDNAAADTNCLQQLLSHGKPAA